MKTYILVGIVLLGSTLAAKNNQKSSQVTDRTLVNVGEIAMWIYSDGRSANSPTGDSGLIFPRGSQPNTSAIFQDGFIWGGQVSDGMQPSIRVGGQTYNTGTRSGSILSPGVSDFEDRIWRVRKDYFAGDLSLDALELGMSEEEVRQQYAEDWSDWPADKGAPFYDADSDGIYTPQFNSDGSPKLFPEADEPGVANADQVVWLVANDLEASVVQSLYASPPIGLEMQLTLWAYDENKPFSNIIFKRLRLIYKGTATTPADALIDSMYICQWVDPDIGAFNDDLVGSDTTLSLGYAYNSTMQDAQYANAQLPPPAVGYEFLHGPVVSSPGDTAIWDFDKRADLSNLPMTTFASFRAGGEDSDPSLQEYDGTLHWWNLLRGFRPRPISPPERWVDSTTGEFTNFLFPGDPLAGTGWIDSGPGDRRILLASGPFTMAFGDTQEVVIGVIAAIEDESTAAPHLRAITTLKSRASNGRNFIPNRLAVDIRAENIVNIGEVVELTASPLLLNKAETVTSYQWSLLERPENSNALLNSTTEANTSFTPDSVGNYSVMVEVTGSSGNTADGFFDIQAISNQPPVAQFTLDKTELTFGDTVFADASASFDPDNDSLQYSWDAFGSIQLMENGRQARIVPFETGNQKILLEVQDQFALSETAQTITIHPKIENMTVDYSFVDSSWAREIFFFHGDTLLVPMTITENLIRVYDITETGIVANTDIAQRDFVQILRLDDRNHLYALKESSSGFFGPGSLSIFSVGDQWQVTPLLEDYLPDLTEIFDITFTDEAAFVRDFVTVHKIDFETDPASPTLLETVDYLSHIRPRVLSEVGPYLYIRTFDGMTGANAIEVRNKSDLNLVQNLNLPNDLRTSTVHDTLMAVGFLDSLNIYSISNPLEPKLISKITVPVEKAPIADFTNDRSHRGKFIENDLLAVDAYGGINIYRIDTPQAPEPVASWYDGAFGFSMGLDIVYNNGSYFVTSKFGSPQFANNPYSGINKITFDFAVSVDEPTTQTVPKEYRLYQNYPNPFNPTTTIRYELPEADQVEIAVFNLLGQKTETLVDEFKPAGSHQVIWDASNISTGVYFYRIKTSNFSKVKKLLLLR